MSIPKLKEFCETHLYHSSKSWTITLGDDDTEHRFGVVYEITNMDDATGDPEFAEYPYLGISQHYCPRSPRILQRIGHWGPHSGDLAIRRS